MKRATVKGALIVSFDMNERADRVSRLMKKFADQPMDMADACLVIMSEQISDSIVITLDESDFSVYRRHGRELVPHLSPDSSRE